MKPFITKTGIRPIKVKVGEVVTLDLTYRGEPDPVATWAKGGVVSNALNNCVCVCYLLLHPRERSMNEYQQIDHQQYDSTAHPSI